MEGRYIKKLTTQVVNKSKGLYKKISCCSLFTKNFERKSSTKYYVWRKIKKVSLNRIIINCSKDSQPSWKLSWIDFNERTWIEIQKCYVLRTTRLSNCLNTWWTFQKTFKSYWIKENKLESLKSIDWKKIKINLRSWYEKCLINSKGINFIIK